MAFGTGGIPHFAADRMVPTRAVDSEAVFGPASRQAAVRSVPPLLWASLAIVASHVHSFACGLAGFR